MTHINQHKVQEKENDPTILGFDVRDDDLSSKVYDHRCTLEDPWDGENPNTLGITVKRAVVNGQGGTEGRVLGEVIDGEILGKDVV